MKMADAVFGDSFVSRLERFTKGELIINKTRKCLFFGVPGMSTKRKFQRMFDQLLLCRPRCVFINIGGNDIDARCKPNDIYLDIINIVEDLYKAGVERVFVASIVQRGKFPYWTGMNQSSFNKIRSAVNKKLKKHLGPNFVVICKRLKYPRHYDNDLVHPGFYEGGMTILKHAVLNAFRKANVGD